MEEYPAAPAPVYECEGCQKCDNGTLGFAIGGAEKQFPETWWCPNGLNLGDTECDDLSGCDPALAAAVEEALEVADPAVLALLLEDVPAVQFVASRRAIQILDCAGKVSRHCELEDDLVEGLAAVQ